MYNFGTSTKCIHKGCEEEMHESWWSATSFKKPGSLAPIKDEGKHTMKAK
jgi:hypothetical protein